MNRDSQDDRLAERLNSALASIRVMPRRMLLDTPGVAATVPMLRGVWGAALHDLDPAAYAAVFGPNDAGRTSTWKPARTSRSVPLHRAGAALALHSAAPRQQQATLPVGGTDVASYILRPAPPDPQFAPAVDWILIGEQALAHDFTLCRAWDVASGMGLGPQRRRFRILRSVALHSDRQSVEQSEPWPLNTITWRGWAGLPTPNSPAPPPECPLDPYQPCRLGFWSPLRLIYNKRLIETPTLADIIVAACRRIKAYLPAEQQADWEPVSREALDTARHTPAAAWQGQRLDLHRYSGRQRRELELRGVTGCLDLPEGPGQLWPLLAAAGWLHLGKGTVMGMGQMEVVRWQ